MELRVHMSNCTHLKALTACRLVYHSIFKDAYVEMAGQNRFMLCDMVSSLYTCSCIDPALINSMNF